MKKIKLGLLFIAGIGLMSIFYSCKSNDPTAFTNATMKPWFETNCASCHANGTYNAGSWLYDPSNDQSIQDHIDHIYSVVYAKKTMPPSGLSQAELDKFKQWYDAGHPSN